MMAYAKPGYTLCVIDSRNQIIRESNQGNIRTAFLEFGEEYKLRIKNKTGLRAYCSVSIDGTEVSPGRKFLLHAHQTLDLERFILDGDLKSGKRFKFISLEEGMKTGEIQDPTSPANGTITVTFEPERHWLTHTFLNNSSPQMYGGNTGIGGAGGYYGVTNGSAPGGPIEKCSSNIDSLNGILRGGSVFATNCVSGAAGSTTTFQSNTSTISNASPAPQPSQAGATVEGSNSNQQFTDSHEFFFTDPAIVLSIQLKGRIQQMEEPKPITYRVNVLCQNCGVKTLNSDVPKGLKLTQHACPNCGVTGVQRAS